jgi:hypothetical protein
LKRRPWFWITVAVWAGIHVWMIARVHWPSTWVPARVWESYTTLDLIAIFVVIALIEKFLHEGPFAPKPRKAAVDSASTEPANQGTWPPKIPRLNPK